jgi:hypothetical protein
MTSSQVDALSRIFADYEQCKNDFSASYSYATVKTEATSLFNEVKNLLAGANGELFAHPFVDTDYKAIILSVGKLIDDDEEDYSYLPELIDDAFLSKEDFEKAKTAFSSDSSLSPFFEKMGAFYGNESAWDKKDIAEVVLSGDFETVLKDTIYPLLNGILANFSAEEILIGVSSTNSSSNHGYNLKRRVLERYRNRGYYFTSDAEYIAAYNRITSDSGIASLIQKAGNVLALFGDMSAAELKTAVSFLGTYLLGKNQDASCISAGEISDPVSNSALIKNALALMDKTGYENLSYLVKLLSKVASSFPATLLSSIRDYSNKDSTEEVKNEAMEAIYAYVKLSYSLLSDTEKSGINKFFQAFGASFDTLLVSMDNYCAAGKSAKLSDATSALSSFAYPIMQKASSLSASYAISGSSKDKVEKGYVFTKDDFSSLKVGAPAEIEIGMNAPTLFDGSSTSEPTIKDVDFSSCKTETYGVNTVTLKVTLSDNTILTPAYKYLVVPKDCYYTDNFSLTDSINGPVLLEKGTTVTSTKIRARVASPMSSTTSLYFTVDPASFDTATEGLHYLKVSGMGTETSDGTTGNDYTFLARYYVYDKANVVVSEEPRFLPILKGSTTAHNFRAYISETLFSGTDYEISYGNSFSTSIQGLIDVSVVGKGSATITGTSQHFQKPFSFEAPYEVIDPSDSRLTYELTRFTLSNGDSQTTYYSYENSPLSFKVGDSNITATLANVETQFAYAEEDTYEETDIYTLTNNDYTSGLVVSGIDTSAVTTSPKTASIKVNGREYQFYYVVAEASLN